MLPDGAIFCGECGRSVNVSANRRPAPAAPVDQAPPPPLQQPDQHGRHPDPATEAWLPEATLDPATRAWLTGADRPGRGVPVDRPTVPDPRQAPTHVHGSAPGLVAPTGGAADHPAADHAADTDAPVVVPVPPEPPLDPNAYPTVTDDGTVQPAATDVDDTERTRFAPRTERPTPLPGAAAGPVGAPAPSAPASSTPAAAAPVWAPAPQTQPVAPSRPSWWVGRGGAREDDVAEQAPTDAATGSDTRADEARANDTAVVEPLVDRRPTRPAPLVTPGSGPTTCHVCGHTLEPDDIFCAECGAVRPAVTAAFTGPVVPLPIARPDWAAEDEPIAGRDDVGSSETEAENDAGADTDADADADAGPASAGGPAVASDDDAPSEGGTHEPESDRAGEDASLHAPATDEPAPPVDGAAQRYDTGSVPTETPRRPIRPRGAHASAQPVALSTPSTPDVPPVPGSPTVPSSAPLADADGGRAVPTAAPLPPLPGAAGAATGPVLPPVGSAAAPTSADQDPEDDVEETRIVAKTATNAPFVLHFSTGERIGVHGTGLLGRLPRPQPGERFDDLLTVHDPGKSVSKTHLELGRDGDDLWVSDRFSGNGTVVRHIDGSIRRCEPGRRYRVERGARVDIGEQFFLVQ